MHLLSFKKSAITFWATHMFPSRPTYAICENFECGQRRFSFDIKSTTCTYSRPIIKFNCEYQKLRNNFYTFDILLMLERAISRDVQIQMLIQALPTNGKNVINFVDFKMNLCDALRATFINPLTKALFTELRRTSNIPYECPLNENFEYSLANYTVTEKTLPSYAPSLNFNFSFRFFETGRVAGKFFLKGSIKN